MSAARRAGVDLVNLGLGGSALLDPFVARVIRDTAGFEHEILPCARKEDVDAMIDRAEAAGTVRRARDPEHAARVRVQLLRRGIVAGL